MRPDHTKQQQMTINCGFNVCNDLGAFEINSFKCFDRVMPGICVLVRALALGVYTLSTMNQKSI